MDRLISLSFVFCLVRAYAPDFSVHPQSQILLIRAKLTLNCTVNPGSTDDGNARNISSIKWLLNGSRVGVDQETEVGQHVPDKIPLVNMHQPMPNQSVLTIERFNATYEGVYQCVAHFGLPQDSSTGEMASLLSQPASVTSATMPKMRKLPDEIIEVVENQTAFISVTIPDMHPSPIVSFVMDNQGTKIPQWSDKYYTSQQGSLQIVGVTQQDTGHYRAVFTNPVGGHERKARQRIRLKVVKSMKNPAWKKLRFLTQPAATTLYARPGHNLSLECAAAGHPSPTVTWERVDAALPPHELILTNLRLIDFRASDAGTYVCSASNGVDVVKSVRTVLVAESPQFRDESSSQENVVAYLGEPLSLACPVVGHVKIQWFHNALLLPNENDPNLDVDSSNHTHSGFYQCFVSNDSGTRSRTFVVNAEMRTTPPTSTTTTSTTSTTTPSTTTTSTSTSTTTTQVTTNATTTAIPATTTTQSTPTTTTTTEAATTPSTELLTSASPTEVYFGNWTDDEWDESTEGTVDPVQVNQTTTEVFVDPVTPASRTESTTEEFSELPDWMPDSDPPREVSTDYNFYGLPVSVNPPQVSVTPADLGDLKSSTRKPKKGKKYHRTTPSGASGSDDLNDDEENEAELLVPPGKPEIEPLSETSVMLRWEVPPNDGLEIASFEVQYRNVDGDTEWTAVPDSIPGETREWKVESLVSGRSYRFRVAAVFYNDVSEVGKKSRKFKMGPVLPKTTVASFAELITELPDFRIVDEVLTAQTVTETSGDNFEPEPPTIERAQSTPTAITIQWSPSGGMVNGFYVLYRESGSTKKFHRHRVLDLTTNTYEITGLQSSTQFEIKMQSFNDVYPSDFSNILEYSTLEASSAIPAEQSTNSTSIQTDAPSETPTSSETSPALDYVTDDNFFRTAGNNTQKTSELLYMVLGIVIGALVLLVLVFTLICRYRQKRLKKKNADSFRGSRNRLRSSSREFVKDRNATLHTPAYRHPAFVANTNGAPFAKSQSDADLEAMRPLSSPRVGDNDSEPETESVERSVPRSRRVSPMDNQSLYHDPNADIYGPERTTDTFRRPSSAHPGTIAAWNEEGPYNMNTARSADYGRRRNQMPRSLITPASAQINCYE